MGMDKVIRLVVRVLKRVQGLQGRNGQHPFENR